MSKTQEDEKNEKKIRKRLKGLYQQIRQQMEFYFSDANLQKDRFLKQQMTSSADGGIDLGVFLRCNKILSLTSDIEVLMNAVATSTTLVVDKDKKTISRLIPYCEPKVEDVDERTVYVECLPTETDREWIRKVLGVYGKIVFISLPRFRSTGDIKGFAFVEYETAESARKACESINHPPAKAEEKVGRFPRSKQLKQLEKRLDFEATFRGRKRRASESEMEKEAMPKLKRKRTMSVGERDEAPGLPTAPPAEQESSAVKCKRRKNTDNGETGFDDGRGDSMPLKEAPVKEDLPTAKLRKRKSSDCGDAGSSLKSETQSQVIETTSKSKKVRKDSKASKLLEEKPDLKQSVKRGRVDSTEDADCFDTKPESTKKARKKEETPEAAVEGKAKALKRKADGDESGEKKAKKVKICDEQAPLEGQEELNLNEADTATDDKTKKKNRPRKNKKSKSKDVPELRVIPKKEWLRFRAEYLQLQKVSMNQLKNKLTEIRTDNKAKPAVPVVPVFPTSQEKESDTKKKSEPEFMEGVIVKVTTDQPVTRKSLKERIWALGSIAYVDLRDQDTLGHVRCNDRETAIAISEASMTGYTFQRLSGVDEQAYWQKLTDERNKKLTTKTRTKNRGRDKILRKADVAYEKTKKPLHVIFD